MGRRPGQRLPPRRANLAVLDDGQRRPDLHRLRHRGRHNTTATHSLSLYRAPSGALVFGAGTVQWSWGLDITNAWNSGPTPRRPTANMQQATVNLLADMGAQPATLQSGLVATGASTDTRRRRRAVSSPSSGAT